MKRMILLIITIIGILFVSCNSTDSKIRKLEKACKAGNVDKAMKIASDLDEHADQLTEEQALRIFNASLTCTEKSTSEMSDIDDDDIDIDDDDDWDF